MLRIEQSVDLALEKRLDFIFAEFDNIYMSFSGGKDSGLLLYCVLKYMKDRGITRRIGVFHLDYEAQYTATTEYVDKVFAELDGQVDAYRICVPFKVTTCTSMFEDHWRPWDPAKKDLWVRPLPEKCWTAEQFPFYREDMWDYDFQDEFSRWLHERTGATKTCCLVGIRAQESLNRWRAIVSERNTNKYQGRPWTKAMFPGVFNAYPIYDWSAEDVWTANARYTLPYNPLYDLFHMAGVPLHDMRVASPFISTAIPSLKLYQVIDPEVWGKLISRVNGVNFAGLYGGTTAMGWREITKPAHFTWREYMDFLLNTLPPATADNYRSKLATSIKFWRERGGVLSAEAIEDLKKAGCAFEIGSATNYKTDKLPVRMEYIDEIDSKDFALIPSFKRVCVCILKNDHQMKYMGFAATKEEKSRRETAMQKYAHL